MELNLSLTYNMLEQLLLSTLEEENRVLGRIQSILFMVAQNKEAAQVSFMSVEAEQMTKCLHWDTLFSNEKRTNETHRHTHTHTLMLKSHVLEEQSNMAPAALSSRHVLERSDPWQPDRGRGGIPQDGAFQDNQNILDYVGDYATAHNCQNSSNCTPRVDEYVNDAPTKLKMKKNLKWLQTSVIVCYLFSHGLCKC